MWPLQTKIYLQISDRIGGIYGIDKTFFKISPKLPMTAEKEKVIKRLKRTIETYQNKDARYLARIIYNEYLAPLPDPGAVLKSGTNRRGNKRNLSVSMIEALKLAVDHSKENDFAMLRPGVVLKKPKHKADFAKLRHWGFIDQEEFGFWTITQKAVAFIYYNEPAFKYIYELHGRATWKSREAITYNEIIKTK